MGGVLHSRVGFELELLAPRGSSRRDLAVALADRFGGEVRPIWHADSEPALVASLGGRFLHLTQGFEVVSGSVEPVCALVDDVTIVTDLDSSAPALPGWHRILTDDPRLLRLLAQVSDPGDPIETALDAAAALWGVHAERIGRVWRLESDGATIALATPSGGERERPCEIVTAPLTTDHNAVLESLLGAARSLEFTVPQEAAIHLHFDGKPFREASSFANVVRLFGWWREPLRALLGTNPQCRRLAALPEELVATVEDSPNWSELRDAATRGGVSKFFDVNLTQLLRDDPVRDTLEVRILPGTLDANAVVEQAAVVEALLGRCCDPRPLPRPPASVGAAVEELQGFR